MVDHGRARKLAERIKVIVAEALERGVIKEPLGFVTITDVRVTGDLQHASIFFTVYGNDEERAEAARILTANKGRIRGEVGRNLTVRLTPTIELILDALPESAKTIDDLLAKAAAADAEVEKLAQVAAYAGDEDPYVKPREISDDDDADAEDETVDVDDVDVATTPAGQSDSSRGE
jgi:ribosome-binding factor A